MFAVINYANGVVCFMCLVPYKLKKLSIFFLSEHRMATAHAQTNFVLEQGEVQVPVSTVSQTNDFSQAGSAQTALPHVITSTTLPQTTASAQHTAIPQNSVVLAAQTQQIQQQQSLPHPPQTAIITASVIAAEDFQPTIQKEGICVNICSEYS